MICKMTGKYILTHDLGTSGNKAVLFDLKLNALYQTKVNYPLYYPKQRWVEQDLKKIIHSSIN